MVKSIKLKSLVEQSDIIVVAVVTKVEADPMIVAHDQREFPPLKVATARVIESWKGPRCAEVQFCSRQPNPVTLRGRKREKR